MTKKPLVISKSSGIIVIEFAVSMLVVVFMLLIVAELGRIFYSYNVVTQSVRNGARYLSENALTPARVLDLNGTVLGETNNIVVTGQLNNGTPLLPGYNASNISISSAVLSGSSNPYVTVAASYNYIPLFSSIPNFWAGNNFNFQITLDAANTMRAIR